MNHRSVTEDLRTPPPRASREGRRLAWTRPAPTVTKTTTSMTDTVKGHTVKNTKKVLLATLAAGSMLALAACSGGGAGGGEGGGDGGLIGVTFKLEGDADSPGVQINPLSAIAPGIFRSIFEFR